LIGYHGTKSFENVKRDGLRISHNWLEGGCPLGHICVAETPEIAAAMAAPGTPVIVVDLDGLEIPEEGFAGGEMRIHHDLEPERLSIYGRDVAPSLAGHVDPYYGYPLRNHPTCVRLMTFQRAHRALPAG
jgi:hypothetical protein